MSIFCMTNSSCSQFAQVLMSTGKADQNEQAKPFQSLRQALFRKISYSTKILIEKVI